MPNVFFFFVLPMGIGTQVSFLEVRISYTTNLHIEILDEDKRVFVPALPSYISIYSCFKTAFRLIGELKRNNLGLCGFSMCVEIV